MSEIDHSMPSSIMIGPFIVRVETVRKNLSSKRKTLAKTILDRLALRLRKKVDDASHLFKSQMKLLYYTLYFNCNLGFVFTPVVNVETLCVCMCV